MAEGWLRHLAGDRFESYSAGSKPAGHGHPLAIKVMSEAGVDVSVHRSKSVDEFYGKGLQYVVTVCDRAQQACPTFPGVAETLNWGFDDPAEAEGSEDQKLEVFRRVRDEIQQRVRLLINSVSKKS